MPRARKRPRLPRGLTERDVLVDDVRRWRLALQDAAVLGLAHLIPGRARRLNEAKERLRAFDARHAGGVESGHGRGEADREAAGVR